MAGDGRKIRVSNGGGIIFEESTEVGTNIGKLVTTNLTDTRVWTLPNKDCDLGGLGPGETYPVSQGGTGFSDAGLGQVPYGSGLEYMNLTPTPTQANTFLGWDGHDLIYAPVAIGPNGEVNTLNSYGTGAQINRGKIGSELQLRSIKAGNGISVTQGTNEIVLDLNMAGFSGVIPVSQGGTGNVTYQEGDLLVGNSSGTLSKMPKPLNGNYFLRRSKNNEKYEWVPRSVMETGIVDVWSGQIDFPDGTKEYRIHHQVPFKFKVKRIVFNMDAGSLVYLQLLVNGTPILYRQITTFSPTNKSSWTVDNPETVYAVDSFVTLKLPTTGFAEGFAFSIVYERIGEGDT